MENIFRLYSELLFRRHPLNATAFFDKNDEQLTLYDGDITHRLTYEAFIIQRKIDDFYYKHKQKENKQYFRKLLPDINRLKISCEEMLFNLKNSLIDTPTLKNSIGTYNNVVCIYHNINHISKIIFEAYNVPSVFDKYKDLIDGELKYSGLTEEDIKDFR